MTNCGDCGKPWSGFGIICDICRQSRSIKEQHKRDQRDREDQIRAQAYEERRRHQELVQLERQRHQELVQLERQRQKELEQQERQRHQDYLELENQRIEIEKERLAVEQERLQLQREQTLSPEDIYNQTKASIQKLDLVWLRDDSFANFPSCPYLDARLVGAFESAYNDFLAESPLDSKSLHALRRNQIDLLLSDIKTALLNDDANQVFFGQKYSTLFDSPTLRVRWNCPNKITLCEKNHFLNVEFSVSLTIEAAEGTTELDPLTWKLFEDLDSGELSIVDEPMWLLSEPELNDYVAGQFKDVLPVLNERKKRRELAERERLQALQAEKERLLAEEERLQAEEERLQAEKDKRESQTKRLVFVAVLFFGICLVVATTW